MTAGLPASRSPFAWILFVGTCALGLVADLYTKIWAFRALAPGDSYDLVPGWLHFEITVNHGAVFGLGQGQRWLFIGVSVLAIGFLSFLFIKSAREQRLYHILLGMLLAGVLGNMYDRITLGHVRDMIHALPRWGIFPYIFNVADSLLCVGVFFMIVYSYFQSPATSGRKLEPQMNADERG